MSDSPAILTLSQLLELWLSTRRLTMRVIDAFPEKELFEFSIGGMRTAADMAHELLQLGGTMAVGVATGEWAEFQTDNPHVDKASLLAAWEEDLTVIERTVPRITAAQFRDDHSAFGLYTSSGLNQLIYALDNETHHRGQMYVYLRALGIEPPEFYERELTS